MAWYHAFGIQPTCILGAEPQLLATGVAFPQTGVPLLIVAEDPSDNPGKFDPSNVPLSDDGHLFEVHMSQRDRHHEARYRWRPRYLNPE